MQVRAIAKHGRYEFPPFFFLFLLFTMSTGCKGNPLTPLCFTVPSASDPPSTVCLVSRGISCLPRYNSSPAVQLVSRSSRFGSSPLPTSRDIMRHHVTYRDVPQSPRYLAPPASLPLPTWLSCDIQRHPAVKCLLHK